MKKKIVCLIFSVALVLLILGVSGRGQRIFWSVLFIDELWNFESRGWQARYTPSAVVQTVSYRGAAGPRRADLYLPPPGRRYAGILLNHGVTESGKDDPRLKRLAEILCRSGFVVFVPDFPGMRSFRISPSDIDEVEVAFAHLLSYENHILPRSCGLFAFSYGAGPTMIAAARPAIRTKVRFVVSFGGYYELKNVLSFLATGNFEFHGKHYSRPPQEYGKWVFLANNLDLVRSPQDRFLLQQIVRLKLQDEKALLDPFLPRLGQEGRDVLALLSHSDPRQTEALIRNLAPSVAASLEKLSVAPFLQDLQADLLLAHGEDDDLIPFTETLRLIQAAPRRVYGKILKSYSHVDQQGKPLTARNIFTFYLPESWKIFALAYKLMEYRTAKG